MNNTDNVRNYLTLQINSLAAMERLIGGTTDVEVDIRNSVVQKFAEKHLTAVANSPIIERTANEIKQNIDKQIAEKCEREIGTVKRNYYGSVESVKLNTAVTDEIDKQVRAKIDAIIAKAVQSALDKFTASKDLESKVQERFAYYANDIINQAVKAKLEKLKASL